MYKIKRKLNNFSNIPFLAIYLAGGGLEQINNPILGDLGLKQGVAFFQAFVPALITILLVIGVLIFFFYIILGAIHWISSAGDKAAVEEARHKITNAIIGVIVLFAVFAFMKLIETFFGIKILTLDIDKLILK
jgi:uncharacterized membrane protein